MYRWGPEIGLLASPSPSDGAAGSYALSVVWDGIVAARELRLGCHAKVILWAIWAGGRALALGGAAQDTAAAISRG